MNRRSLWRKCKVAPQIVPWLELPQAAYGTDP